MSTPKSRNYESFRNTLEKMRNDSLRLNKGVQTEGDAQRAWQELVAHINDPAVVRQRLEEIQDLNQQAIDFHKETITQLREDAGLPPIDVNKFMAKPLPATRAAGSSAPAAASGQPVAAAPVSGMPPVSKLQEGQITPFKNGQQWTLRNGKQVRVK